MSSNKSVRGVIFNPIDFSKIKKTNKNFREEFWKAFNYAHYEITSSDLKKEVIKYLKNIKHPMVEKIKDVDEFKFTSIGKFCYIANHGGELIDDSSETLVNKLSAIIEQDHMEKSYKNQLKNKEEIVVTKVVTPVKDKSNEKANSVIAEIDSWLDDYILNKKTDKDYNDFVGLLQAAELKTPQLKYISDYYKKPRAEVLEASAGNDAQLSEAYSHYGKIELRRLVQFYDNIFTACEKVNDSNKIIRLPKRTKPVPAHKLVAKLKYQLEDTTLGLKSVNPVHIIGAKEVWTYDTKTRKLCLFKAADSGGLSVKGASIISFSNDCIQKTLRKPKETLTEFNKIDKKSRKTFMDKLTTMATTPKGRLNETTIILKIEK
jgi:hypothetical protein